MPRLGTRKRRLNEKAREDSLGKPRLADLACNGLWMAPHWLHSQPDEFRRLCEEAVGAMRGMIRDSVVVAADNVSEYLFAGTSQEEWDFTVDFPCCAPPFPLFFLEFRRPSCILSDGHVRPSADLPPSWGWIVESETREQMEAKLADPEVIRGQITHAERQMADLLPVVDRGAIDAAVRSPDRRAAFESLGDAEKTLIMLATTLRKSGDPAAYARDLAAAIHPEIKWFLKLSLVIGADARVPADVVGPIVYYTFPVAADGRVLSRPGMAFYGGHTPEFLAMSRAMIDSTSGMLFPAMLAISFMNCKNVAINAVEPNAELNRIRERRGDRPFLRYHTIDIEPMKRVLRTEGGVEANGLKKALHIVRGHFSTYTEERKLFGKVAGTFWVPSHIRGSAREGVVISDYRVNAPDQKVTSSDTVR